MFWHSLLLRDDVSRLAQPNMRQLGLSEAFRWNNIQDRGQFPLQLLILEKTNVMCVNEWIWGGGALQTHLSHELHQDCPHSLIHLLLLEIIIGNVLAHMFVAVMKGFMMMMMMMMGLRLSLRCHTLMWTNSPVLNVSGDTLVFSLRLDWFRSTLTPNATRRPWLLVSAWKHV